MVRRQIGFEPPAAFDELDDPGSNGDRMPASTPTPVLLSLLQQAAARQASDVHLVPGYPATFRVNGRLERAAPKALTSDDIRCMAESILPAAVFETFEQTKNADCSLSVEKGGAPPLRFRANVYLARDGWCICLRHIPNEIPTLDWLGFPKELAERLVAYQDGLVLVTGETGSGKTSTLAALIDLARQTRDAHIITIEEPIEYIHEVRGLSIVTQREVGRDVSSFADGLKYGLRQDPDIILVGEVRDRDTAQMAISAAETGHLVFATMHTRDAKGALTRLVDLFPQDSQDDIRTQLALSLRSVVSQKLLPPAEEGQRRVLALEVLHASQPVQVAIRSGRIETLDSALQTGARSGMIMLDDDLRRLVREGKITTETARLYAKDPNLLGAVAKSW
ncbi:MAG: PilT/PilU family type 4a pilus ATPase [Phycisphaerae bacterium]|nr:PilT/PilU family type 4a pilus ATPase [Phycisphaerae bacterium]